MRANLIVYGLMFIAMTYTPTLAVVIIAFYCTLGSLLFHPIGRVGLGVRYAKRLAQKGMAQQYVEYLSFICATGVALYLSWMGHPYIATWWMSITLVDLYCFRVMFNAWKNSGRPRILPNTED